MTLRVLIAVTHLLGVGHLARAAALGRAFAKAGHRATLVSGGMPAPLVPLDGVALVQLPSVRTQGTDFRTLLDEAGAPIGPERLASRRERLLSTIHEVRPHVVITELFPFGRRGLADEFLALIEAARALAPQPLIATSIRDILVAPAKPARIAEAHERLARLYDAALVHGDPDLLPLDASWPVDPRTQGLLRYTGYVDEGVPVESAAERSGIVVSGGSSAASLPLYRTALAASGLVPSEAWRVLVGNGVPQAAFESLSRQAPPHVTVERARRDFRALLGRAALSVSQAGYNTCVDLLRARVPAILVPFEGGHETEQRLRSEKLQALELAHTIPEADLSAERLAAAIRDRLGRPPPPVGISLDGAERSVAIVEGLAPRPAARTGTAWSRLDDALERATDAGCALSFWWRDDDATAAAPALDRLVALSQRYRIPLALAAIPERTEPSLSERLHDEPLVEFLVHGLAHANHAPAGEKKAEFGAHRPLHALCADAARAFSTAKARLGPRLVPAFVPPWNRIAPDLVAALPALGYCGLSTFKDRTSRTPVPGLVQANTHIDPIDWRGTRSAFDPDVAVSALVRAIEARTRHGTDGDEPIGLLTHHLVHDEAVWSLCERLIEQLSRHGRVHYPFAGQVFSAAGV